jgi:solute carrier family 35
MFTVLRRFSILITMILEKYMLGSEPSARVQLSVFLMIFGTIVAALSDLSFDLQGYIMILLNDLFTALNGVVMKKTMNSCAINKMGILFHNSWIRYGLTQALFSSASRSKTMAFV